MNIWLISDTHFKHKNILKYTSRPFSSIEEMDEKLISNWNNIVKQEDTVYHMGDFALTTKKERKKYFDVLNGKIILIKGSHDQDMASIPLSYYLKRGKSRFILIHDYRMFSLDRPWYKDFWIIHGHNHDKVPFFDRKNKRINVSVENINYTPIHIDEILKLINGGA